MMHEASVLWGKTERTCCSVNFSNRMRRRTENV
uniref:Uncharacterized protein n=1 Tax=Anguilla anguilla TaxID=7936 RepID=A0A0E9P6W7_ANGAN